MAGLVPGTVITDDRGAVAQLHGAGIQDLEGRYFAWGENKIAGGAFTSIAAYSSRDLITWTFEGDALTTREAPGLTGLVVERPKVLRRPDGDYVMFLHIDDPDYARAEVGYAVSSSPTGPFEYLGSRRPLDHESRDIGVYQEGDRAYLLSEDRRDGLHIFELTDDYLDVRALIATTRNNEGTHGLESPALVKHRDLYYLFGSELTGWSHNDNQYATAASLAGPWSPWREIAPKGSRTFESQISSVVPVATGGHLYVGDRWKRDDLGNSPAVWLPITLDGGVAHLEWRDEWIPGLTANA